MTRARDELILTHAADYGGGIARRVSPFVLEALDLPPRRPSRVPGAPAATPLDRIAAASSRVTPRPSAAAGRRSTSRSC